MKWWFVLLLLLPMASALNVSPSGDTGTLETSIKESACTHLLDVRPCSSWTYRGEAVAGNLVSVLPVHAVPGTSDVLALHVERANGVGTQYLQRLDADGTRQWVAPSDVSSFERRMMSPDGSIWFSARQATVAGNQVQETTARDMETGQYLWRVNNSDNARVISLTWDASEAALVAYEYVPWVAGTAPHARITWRNASTGTEIHHILPDTTSLVASNAFWFANHIILTGQGQPNFDHQVFAWYARNGSLVRETHVMGAAGTWGQPALDAATGMIHYTGDYFRDGTHIEAINATTGVHAWSKELLAWPAAPAFAASNGMLVVAREVQADTAGLYNVHAAIAGIDAKSGALRWSLVQETPTPSHAFAVDVHGTIAAVTGAGSTPFGTDDFVQLIDIATGAVLDYRQAEQVINAIAVPGGLRVGYFDDITGEMAVQALDLAGPQPVAGYDCLAKTNGKWKAKCHLAAAGMSQKLDVL